MLKLNVSEKSIASKSSNSDSVSISTPIKNSAGKSPIVASKKKCCLALSTVV